MQKQSIYLVDGSHSVTGALVAARQFAAAMQDLASVTLVTGTDSQVPCQISKHFSGMRRVPITNLRRSIGSSLVYIPNLLKASIKLKKLLYKDCCSILIINDFHLMHGVILRLLGFNGHIITWVRTNPRNFPVIGRIWLFLAQKASSKVIAVSNAIRINLPNKPRAVVIYDYVIVVQDKASRPCCTNNFAFVFIANYTEGKGQDIAIRALKEVKKYFSKVTLHFYGGTLGLEKNAKYLNGLVALSSELGLIDSAFFNGYISEPAMGLNEKYAALNLSRSEGFGLTVAEACAYGLPVIATRCGGPEEIIVDGETGILIAVDDVVACSAAMVKLCEDPQLAQRMGAAGRAFVSRRFSKDYFRERLVQILDIV